VTWERDKIKVARSIAFALAEGANLVKKRQSQAQGST